MINLTFAEFYKDDFVDAGYALYFLHDAEGRALYIGISTDSIWHRWFAGGTGHMVADSQGRIHGMSHIGRVVEDNLPLSWKWRIDLFTEEDCLDELADGPSRTGSRGMGLKLLEELMITKFSPLYNVMNSGGYHEDPTSSKRLDDEYRKIFR